MSVEVSVLWIIMDQLMVSSAERNQVRGGLSP